MIKKIDLKAYKTFHEDILQLLIDNYQINLPEYDDITEICMQKIHELEGFIIDGSAVCYGFECNSRIVGFLWTYRKFQNSSFKVHIAHLVVCSEYRGQGIGNKLFYALDKEFHDNPAFIGYELYASCENEKAIDFYRKIGFTETRVFMEMRKPFDLQ